MNKYVSIYLIIIISFINILISETNISDSQKKEIEAVTNDMFMAPDFELHSVDDKKYKLSNLKGNVVVLNFWATWCGPCRMEIPDFNDLYSKNKDNGLIILGISTDDSKRQLTNFLKTYKIDYPVLYGSSKQISKISNDYGGIMALPTSIIIDRKGINKFFFILLRELHQYILLLFMILKQH